MRDLANANWIVNFHFLIKFIFPNEHKIIIKSLCITLISLSTNMIELLKLIFEIYSLEDYIIYVA